MRRHLCHADLGPVALAWLAPVAWIVPSAFETRVLPHSRMFLDGLGLPHRGCS